MIILQELEKWKPVLPVILIFRLSILYFLLHSIASGTFPVTLPFLPEFH